MSALPVCPKQCLFFFGRGDDAMDLIGYCNSYGCRACRLRRLFSKMLRIEFALAQHAVWNRQVFTSKRDRDNFRRRANNHGALCFFVAHHRGDGHTWYAFHTPLPPSVAYPDVLPSLSIDEVLAHVKTLTNTDDLASVRFSTNFPRTIEGAREYNRAKRRRLSNEPKWFRRSATNVSHSTFATFIRENHRIDIDPGDVIPLPWVLPFEAAVALYRPLPSKGRPTSVRPVVSNVLKAEEGWATRSKDETVNDSVPGWEDYADCPWF